MTPVVLVLMALLGFWLWLYFAALLWDGLGGRWAQKSERGRSWLRAQKEKLREKRHRNLKDALVLLGAIPYHAIWVRPGYSFGISLFLLAVLSCLLIA